MDKTYKILRFHAHRPTEVIETGLTYEEARAHCRRPDTSNMEEGWFEGYADENPTDEELEERAEKDARLLDACHAIERLVSGD